MGRHQPIPPSYLWYNSQIGPPQLGPSCSDVVFRQPSCLDAVGVLHREPVVLAVLCNLPGFPALPSHRERCCLVLSPTYTAGACSRDCQELSSSRASLPDHTGIRGTPHGQHAPTGVSHKRTQADLPALQPPDESTNYPGDIEGPPSRVGQVARLSECYPAVGYLLHVFLWLPWIWGGCSSLDSCFDP